MSILCVVAVVAVVVGVVVLPSKNAHKGMCRGPF